MARRQVLSTLILVGFVIAGFSTETRGQQPGTAEPLRGIADYVLQFGSMMSLPEQFCDLLNLHKANEPCPYKHIGMSNSTEAKAVEVSREPGTGRIDIVIGWKTAEDGYLFSVTPKGELLKAIYMKKGAAAVVVENASVREKLQREIAFWLEQEPRLRASPLAR